MRSGWEGACTDGGGDGNSPYDLFSRAAVVTRTRLLTGHGGRRPPSSTATLPCLSDHIRSCSQKCFAKDQTEKGRLL